ncbi:SusC/RagA family TonB-linked outer membrane protein [uncultured Arcticibacterium sp.]|uniref:SusC/RagA family TonB-linked outer membrane protein n=1 Tax=uncultured Arcticibacterium sp. TaxID=2173042 RepID=UPI0030FC5D6A
MELRSTYHRTLRRLFITTVIVGFCFSAVWAQAQTVTGTITAEEDGSVIPGVNVVLKGTFKGTTSNANGKYSIDVEDANSVLIFSFVGYNPIEVTVGSRSVINVPLSLNASTLNEVVVTALGIKREEKSLGYSVAKVDGEDMNRVTTENVLNGMSGKVAGVSINSTGGTGSSVSMVIRGAKSLSSDNQPLFVIDGVPIINTLNNVSQIGGDNRVDYGNAISDLNPDNIESISVLKGPSAAALYGSRAGNGVVIITTKNGSKNNKMTVSLTTNTVFDKPYRYLNMHSQFATGILPFTEDNNPYPGGVLYIDEGSAGGVGPELDLGQNAIQWNSPLDADGNPIPTPLVSHPNNIENFVQTGITTTNGISLANSNDVMNYRVSYSNMSNRGIIPNSDLFKNSLALNTTININKKLRLSTVLDLSRNNSNNRPAGERGSNPLQWAYAVSPHIDILELEDYWVPGQEGLQQKSQSIGNFNNPYFLAYEVNNAFERNRIFGNMKLDYQLTPEINLMARYALDSYKENRETKIGASYDKEPRGAYGLINLGRYERNIDALATYSKNLENFSLSFSVGGNARSSKFTNVSNASRNGTGLVIPGLFTLENIAPANLSYSSSLLNKVVYSAYGIANLGFKDMLYLDLTARNDWSSTLPVENRSYFYPSASLSFLVNELFPTPSSSINMLKLRGGVAQVGNDTNPYALINTLDNNEAWGGITRLSKSGTILLPDLKPEISTSYEVGVDLTMFRNKLRFSGTYYKVDNRNQIIPTKLPSSTGYTSKNINAGLLVSKGIELTLGGTPFERNGWRLDLTTNFYKNATTIESLSEGLDFYTLWTDAKGGAWTYVGETIGDIYDRELVTVKDQSSPYYGYPILDSDGSWQDINANNTKTKIGNFNPDFILGMQTSLTYKKLSLNMTFDWRKGGDFVSQTYRYGESDLKSQRFLDNLINPNGLSGDALRDYLVANEDDLIRVNGNNFNIVGGPTAEYGGFPFEYGGNTYAYAVFNPGVLATYNENGEIEGYTENLGGAGTKYIPYGDNYPWSFTKAALFDASFVKLREISFAYDITGDLTQKLGLQNASFSVYSRNIILWTAANIGIDPEMAFQPQAGTQAGTQFKQGIERYNVTPWVIPVGFKLNLTF